MAKMNWAKARRKPPETDHVSNLDKWADRLLAAADKKPKPVAKKAGPRRFRRKVAKNLGSPPVDTWADSPVGEPPPWVDEEDWQEPDVRKLMGERL